MPHCLCFERKAAAETIVNLRARGKGELAWQGDGHETHGRCEGSCAKRSRATQASAALTHTHILNDMVAHVTGIHWRGSG